MKRFTNSANLFHCVVPASLKAKIKQSLALQKQSANEEEEELLKPSASAKKAQALGASASSKIAKGLKRNVKNWEAFLEDDDDEKEEEDNDISEDVEPTRRDANGGIMLQVKGVQHSQQAINKN